MVDSLQRHLTEEISRAEKYGDNREVKRLQMMKMTVDRLCALQEQHKQLVLKVGRLEEQFSEVLQANGGFLSGSDQLNRGDQDGRCRTDS